MSERARVVGDVPAAWETLLESDPNATPAHRPELWSALVESLPGSTLFFVAVEEGGALIGGAPFLVERRLGFHWIRALPYLLGAAPLARPVDVARVDRAVAEAIGRAQHELAAVGGEWALYRPEGPPPDPHALEVVSGEWSAIETWIIDVGPGPEALWRGLHRDTRHTLRRARAAGLRFAEEPAALDEGYALHLAQARRWSGYRPRSLELSRRLLAAGEGRAAARLYTVRLRGELLTATLFLAHRRELMAWWSGSRRPGRIHFTGAFMFWSAIERAHAEGVHRLNLGGSGGVSGVDDFKRSLGARAVVVPVRWLDAAHAPWHARLVAGLQRRARGARFRGAPA